MRRFRCATLGILGIMDRMESEGLKSMAAVEGVIVVNKPAGWTSHDVVARMRGIAGTRRVGHLGTLDPLATGVLPVMIGQITRLAQFWDHAEKTYEAVIRFGFATSSYDREGEITGEVTEPTVTVGQVEDCLSGMRGVQEQTPPPVSAKKINGVPAYKYARKNITVELKPVKVTILALELLELEGSRGRFRVQCSAGTYVRAIAHELGQKLGCGAHVEELLRTQAGPFRLEHAFTLDRLQALKDNGQLETALVPRDEMLPHFPGVFVDALTVTHIRQGRDFSVSAFRVQTGTEFVKALGSDGRLVAIGKIVLPHMYHPVVVLN